MKRQIIHKSTQIAISFSSILPAANQLSTLLRGHINNFDAKVMNQTFLSSVLIYYIRPIIFREERKSCNWFMQNLLFRKYNLKTRKSYVEFRLMVVSHFPEFYVMKYWDFFINFVRIVWYKNPFVVLFLIE